MNEIITKAVEELKSDKPDLSYIRGMLETVLAMSQPMSLTMMTNPPKVLESKVVSPVFDEATLLEAPVKEILKSMPPITLE